MAEMDLVELVAIAQSGGSNNPLPEHILQSATIVDLQTPDVVTNGVLGISFDPETAQFISVFGDDLVVVTEDQDTIIIKDFVPAVTDGFLVSIELLDGALIEAPEFLEQYGIGTNIADALSDIDTAAGDSSTQNSVTNFAERERFNNEEIGSDSIRGGPSGTLGRDGFDRFDRANGSGRPFGGRDGDPSNGSNSSNNGQSGPGSSGGPVRDTEASTPTLDVGETVVGLEDVAIPLSISAALTDLDGSETLAITISGLPEGASLNAGYFDAVSGAWVLTAAELDGLSLIPAENASGNFSLTVHAIAVESDGGARAITSDTLEVDITPGADAPTLTLSSASGDEDTAIALDISSSLTDDSETLSVEISGIPEGAVLTADGEAVTVTDGVATLTPAQLANLTITPPANSSDDFDLTVTATSTDGSDTATTTATLPVTVTGVADAATVATADAAGSEDTAIALNIDVTGVQDGDSASITISDIPAGATLSAGTANEDGSVTLTPAELEGLAITPAADSDADFTLSVAVTTTDGQSGDTSTVTDTLDVTVDAVADAPTLTVDAASGNEDTAIVLDISSALTDTDGSEMLSVEISGIPDGAVLTADGEAVTVTDGVATLTPAQLSNLTITPPSNSSDDFDLTVTATSTDGSDTATTTATLPVTVTGVADAATVATADAAGSEDTAIALNIDVTGVQDGDSASITISDIPTGATLSAGTVNQDGSVTLTPAELEGLTITPAANSDADFTLSVAVTTTDGQSGDTSTVTDTLDVTVDAVADAPTLTVDAASGSEDTAIALDISSALTDTDGSETLSVEISGIPEGAVLTADGEAVTVTDGVATLTPAQLANLAITPPTNSSDDFDLTVTATSTDGSDTATTTATLPVSVTGVADAATVATADAAGSEDTAIALNIDVTGVQDGDSATITISDIPTGATLSAGTVNQDGSVTLTPAELEGLTITPAANSDADFTLSVAVTTTDGQSGDTSTVTDTLDVTVDAVADAPTLTVDAAAGSEDTAIALDISSALTDTDGSETLSVEISGIPDGAVLTADGEAVIVTDGVATLTPAQLSNLTITPPANSSDDFDLTVTATSTDGSDTATTTATLPVSVTGVADAATVATADAAGSEDTAIALNIDVTGVQDGDSASITISDIPTGATLSAGTVNQDGSVTLTPAELAGLTITPAADSDAGFTLSVAVTTTDGQSGDTSTVTDTLDVTVDAVADAPTLTVDAASGSEDTAIALDISSALTDTDGSETLSVEISGIPEGSVLTADGEAVTVTDGVATLTPAQLANLAITPPANSSDDFDLTVTATSTDGTDTATTTATLPVTVTGVADAPTLSTEAASGDEDTAIALDISSALTDTDGSETLSVEISGIPEGAVLTADGEAVTVTDGVATLTPAQLANLAITPPANSSDDFDLTVTATSTDGSDTATTTATLPVTVTGVADAATVATADAAGSEDTAIALNIDVTGVQDGDSASITISDIPAGATLSAGTVNQDGSVTLTPAELEGLTITPAANSDADFTLSVAVTTTDGQSGDTSTVTDTLDVTVDAVADAPTLTVDAASGSEDTAIALDISSALMDNDGSETLSVEISGIPEGAVLTADGEAVTVTDGVATLTPAQLANLAITPPANSSDDFDLTVTATSTDGSDTATTTATLPVTVTGVADAPTLSTEAASGTEDKAIALDISSALTDNSETLSVEISGIPEGSVLTADGEAVTVTDGVATLTPAQLSNLTITPPANSSDDFDLTVTATSTDGLDTATTTATLPVSVTGVADAPTLSTEAASGSEDTAITLDISSALTDDSETLSVEISGIPEGAVLTADGEAVTVTDGVATLTPAQLSNLTITPPANSSDDFDLTVTATSTDGTDTATTTATLPVTVTGVADAATVATADAAGSEDTAIALNIDVTGVQDGDSATITISDIPAGATLSAGTVNQDGSVTLTPAELEGLTITPAANSDADFTLSVAVTTTDGQSGDTSTVTDTLDVTVDAVADAPTLAVDAASGSEDTAIALDISSALTDIDGSETLSVEISGIPEGSVITADGEAVTVTDGVAMLTPAQLSNLTITPPANSSDDFDLTVTATSTDGSDTATTTATLPVTVTGVADAATVATADAAGSEDTAIALNIDVTGVQDGDSASITISDIPTGATLSAGTVNQDGSVTLTPAELEGLTITPAANSDADFTLSVAVSTTDGQSGDTSTVTDTLDVTVDAVADAPTLTLDVASGNEDTAIALDISSALTDTDGSETLSVEISGIPEGAVLTADGEAVTVTDGVATLTPAQLANLTITPPANSSDDFDLTVTATSTDGSDTATTTATLPVSVTGVADAATVATADAAGSEDTAIALNIDVTGVQDGDSASITISDIPTGATLSAGTVNQDGSVTLTPAELAGLTITPAADSDAGFTLSVAVTTTDGQSGDTSTVTDTLDVTVDAVADAPTLTVDAASGSEDTAIALDISSALTDTDGSETLSVEISGIPEGSVLTADGEAVTVTDGVATLTPAQLANLAITPPANSSDDFDLTVTATSTDGSDTATTTATLPVTVTGVADAATVATADAAGSEDTAIALNIDVTGVQDGDSASITISDIPTGATLSAGTVNQDGSVTLTPAELEGLTITPAANSDADFTLSVAVTTTDGQSGDTSTVTDTLDVTVDAVADAPTLTVDAASGSEDTAIALDISSALTDTDGSETLSVEISGIPEGAVLTADGETVTVTDGVATLTPAQLANLAITPPANSSDDFDLTVTATSTDGTDTATTTATLPVTVTGVADAATVATADAAGSEDTAIALNIDVTGVQDGDSASITISDIPAGATLSAGTVNQDGSVTLTPAELAGLTITPAADSDADFTLSVAVTTTDGQSGDTSTVTDTLDVTVDAVADAPTLTVDAAAGSEDTAIALDISSALTDDSETLSVEISGIPEGAVLTADGEVVTVTDGVATLTPAQLSNLTITPPANSSDDFDLTVTATSTDGSDTATTTATLPVTVTGVADAATVATADAAGSEDTTIALNIDVTGVQDGDSASITISDIPAGATLSAGTVNQDGSVTLTPAELEGLTITPAANSDADFTLSVAVTTTDGQSGDTSTVTDTLDVTVDAVADAPTLTVDAAAGSEDTAIALDISSALTDTDGSETLSVEISGIPEGAVLTADGEAVIVTDGVATLTPAQLANITITPPANSSDDFDLTVTATSTDGSDTATTTATLPVTVTGVADAPTLTTNAASGSEDTAIELDLSAALTDGSETLSIEISGIPEGAVLTADGDAVTITDGIATLTPAQLANLTITPPVNSSDDFDLTVTATSTDGTDTATTVGTVPITVTGIADTPELDVQAASGDEDTAIDLDISAALSDDNETLSVEISGIPNGATLTANGIAIAVTGGVAVLTAGQLDALAITPPANSSEDFTLTVTATSTDGTSTATTEGTIPVTVHAVADTPSLSTTAASGTEDHAIALQIQTSSADSGETLSITIGGIPDGAVLMSGATEISITDGEATLTPAQLSNLTITPASNDDEDFDLSVTVTSTDGASTATQTGTLTVSVDPDADTPSLTLSGSTAVIDPVTTPLTLPDSITEALENSTEPYDLPAGNGLSGQVFDTNGTQNSLAAADALIAAGGPDVSFTATAIDYEGGDNIGQFLESDGNTATGTTNATADSFVVKIVGYIKIEAGNHNFSVTSDDGFRLKIGGETVTEFVSDRSPETSNGSFNALEDGLYPIEIVYWENGGGQVLNVQMDGTTLGGNILYSTLPEGVIANGDGSYSIPETVDASTSLTISDLPDNAVLSAGTKNADGTWTVTPEQAEGLTVTYPDGAIHTVTATVTDSHGAELASADIMTGALQTFTAELNIQSALVDIDGSETLSIQISADSIPDGAVFSAGEIQEDGSVILTADELDGLTVQFPVGTEDFNLSITATSTDGSDTASITQSLTVTVPDIQGGTYVGTEGADTIVGSAGDDVIYGDGDPNAVPEIVETPVNGIFHFALEDTTWSKNETVTDSLNGLTGTAKDDTGSTTGANGQAAQFDGNKDRIEVPHTEAMELTKGTFSIDFLAWNNGTLASKDSSGYDDGGHFDLNINSNHVVELRVQTEDETFTLSGGTINYEDWQSASVTWDGDTVTLYVNGTAVDSVQSDWNLSENQNPWTFGASQINSDDNAANNLTDYLNGKIDNPTLLDQPLSAEQIAAMHTNGIPATLASGLTVPSDEGDAAGSDTLLSEDFSNGSGSFTYSDGVFGTNNGYYESGSSGASNGETGGGLAVTLGGQNNSSVSGMSGGWTTTINVDDTTENTTLTFKVRMVYPANSEAEEGAEVRVALDGQLIGDDGQDYVLRYEGDGDGGSDYDSGWQTVTLDLGSLPAGEHTITLGGYYEGKTTSDEEVNIFFDDVSVTGDSVFTGTTQVADRTEMFHTTFEDKSDGFHNSSDGWQTNSDKIEVRSDTTDNFGAATDGHNYIELNTDPDDIYADAASIYRDIQTEAGRIYEMTFSYSGRPGYDDSVNSMLVTANGTSLGTFTHDMENSSTLDWQTVTVRFTGTGETMRLEFGESSNADVDGGRGMMLDDITLVDTGYGPSVADTIDGGAGNDTIFGGEGADIIDGGAGDDVINGGSGADTIDGGTGSDTIDYANSDEGVIIDFQNGLISGGDAEGDSLTGIENITGSAHDDTLTGDAGDNRIQGRAGADTLDGGAGNDTLDYSDSDEAVTINFESGMVSGGDATGDQIANFENMLGSDFNDTLVGDDGDNRIDGGKGSDLLTGGDGADVFVLGSPGDGIDTITDFNIAEGDRLDVSSVVNMNDIDDIANYLKVEDDGAGNSTVMVNTSGDGEAANFTAIASLEGVTNIDINSILQDQNPSGENV